MGKCGAICEIFSRVCGYFRPVSNWNKGKREEFKDRKVFDVSGLGNKKEVNGNARKHKNSSKTAGV